MEIINKVAESSLVEFNLEDYYQKGERLVFDMKDHLFQELILKEKDFRDFVKNENWNKYQDKLVAITCTADAIVPTWAYMLVAVNMESFAKKIVFGNLEILETILFHEALSKINLEEYKDKRVMIKGCSHFPVPPSAYVEIARLFRPVVKSMMYGEACSTVPLYKQ